MWGGAGGIRIVNLLTQDGGYGRGARPGKASALPRLATGVGGLDWHEVQPLIQNQLGDLNIPIYIYTVYHPGADCYGA